MCKSLLVVAIHTAAIWCTITHFPDRFSSSALSQWYLPKRNTWVTCNHYQKQHTKLPKNIVRNAMRERESAVLFIRSDRAWVVVFVYVRVYLLAWVNGIVFNVILCSIPKAIELDWMKRIWLVFTFIWCFLSTFHTFRLYNFRRVRLTTYASTFVNSVFLFWDRCKCRCGKQSTTRYHVKQ